MGDLTKNFSRHEFACVCGCGFDTVDFALVGALQACADFFSVTLGGKVSIIVTGKNRCVRHNTALRDRYKETNGKEGALTAMNSQHVYGRAADIKVYFGGNQIDSDRIADYFERHHPQLSVGRYSNRTHIDSRSGLPARWDER